MNMATVEEFGTLIAPRTLEIKRLLPGPMERIWDYLTKSELRRQWLASGDMELKVGSEFQLTWRNSELVGEKGQRPSDKSEVHTETMCVTVCEPPCKLAYTFGKHGEVSYELAPAGNKILLTLIHSNAPNRGTLLGVSAGWHAHLDVLFAVLSGTKPKAFWDNLAEIKPIYDKRIPADS